MVRRRERRKDVQRRTLNRSPTAPGTADTSGWTEPQKRQNRHHMRLHRNLVADRPNNLWGRAIVQRIVPDRGCHSVGRCGFGRRDYAWVSWDEQADLLDNG